MSGEYFLPYAIHHFMLTIHNRTNQQIEKLSVEMAVCWQTEIK